MNHIEEWLRQLGSNILARFSDNGTWPRVFGEYWGQQVKTLSASIETSAAEGMLSLRCADFESSANILFEAVSAEPLPQVRDVWTYARGDRLFSDVPWKRYCECSARYVFEGRLKKQFMLLVLDDNDTPDDEPIRQLLRFFKSHDAYACRWLSSSQYVTTQAAFGLAGAFVDFAVYGSDVVFLATSYEPSEGSFIGGGKRVETYVRMFDELWSQGRDTADIVAHVEPMSLHELMAYDQDA